MRQSVNRKAVQADHIYSSKPNKGQVVAFPSMLWLSFECNLSITNDLSNPARMKYIQMTLQADLLLLRCRACIV